MDNDVIREARVEDVPAIVDMIRAGSNEGVFHSQAFSLEEQKEAFKKNAFEERPEGYQVLVSQVGSRIVGYIDYRVRRGVGHVLGIYVKQAYRKQGVGKGLVRKVLNDFKRKGCHKTRLEVFAQNCGAIQFYKYFGFAQEGFLHKDEEKKDEIIMSKFLP